MRRRFVQVNGELVEVGLHQPTARASADVVDDIQPYKSMITGEMITSRSQHREHLRQHNCIELGNEKPAVYKAGEHIPDVAPQRRLEAIRAQVASMPNKEFDKMMKRDLDNIRWNSRRD